MRLRYETVVATSILSEFYSVKNGVIKNLFTWPAFVEISSSKRTSQIHHKCSILLFLALSAAHIQRRSLNLLKKGLEHMTLDYQIFAMLLI